MKVDPKATLAIKKAKETQETKNCSWVVLKCRCGFWVLILQSLIISPKSLDQHICYYGNQENTQHVVGVTLKDATKNVKRKYDADNKNIATKDFLRQLNTGSESSMQS